MNSIQSRNKKITDLFQPNTLKLIVLVVFVIILACLLLMLGNTFYSLTTIMKVLFGETIQGASFTISVLRLPKMLLALLSGFAFGLSGYIFQSILRNPLASPDIIGVTSTTSTTAIILILFANLSGFVVSLTSVIVGFLVSILIYRLSFSKGYFSSRKMILIGIAVQTLTRSLTNFSLINASEYDVSSSLRWLSGSLSNSTMKDVYLLLIVVIISFIICLSFSKEFLNIELGQEKAISIGTNIKLFYLVMIIIAVSLVSFSTSLTGPIASVSFLAGSISRRLFKGLNNLMIPSGLIGSFLILSAELVGQNMFVMRYPVGIITGILGAPYLFYLVLNQQKGR